MVVCVRRKHTFLIRETGLDKGIYRYCYQYDVDDIVLSTAHYFGIFPTRDAGTVVIELIRENNFIYFAEHDKTAILPRKIDFICPEDVIQLFPHVQVDNSFPALYYTAGLERMFRKTDDIS